MAFTHNTKSITSSRKNPRISVKLYYFSEKVSNFCFSRVYFVTVKLLLGLFCNYHRRTGRGGCSPPNRVRNCPIWARPWRKFFRLFVRELRGHVVKNETILWSLSRVHMKNLHIKVCNMNVTNYCLLIFA